MYKLQNLEPMVVDLLLLHFPDKESISESLKHYKRSMDDRKIVYCDFETVAIFAIHRLLENQTKWYLFDKMKEEYPAFNDSHIATLMKRAIRKAYGCTIIDLIEI